MSVSINLGGRVVLVCGVARGGIGGATARRIALAGATIFAVDHARDLIDQTAADVAAAGGVCDGLVADLTDPDQSDKVVAAAVERFGRLDGVANVAGGTKAHECVPLEKTPTSVFRNVLNLNLEYVFRICRDAAAYWIDHQSPGAIVNVGSVSAVTSAPFHGPYGAAKSGIAALTRTMAVEWREHDIRANTVQPGIVATERVTARADWGIDASKSHSLPYASVDELANTVLFLLSDLASGISGQTLTVDCSLSANSFGGGVEVMRKLAYKDPG
jgi:NAD(P)-dependent dehydrogenase (short-subunit alcohol dehydrogenase family)